MCLLSSRCTLASAWMRSRGKVGVLWTFKGVRFVRRTCPFGLKVFHENSDEGRVESFAKACSEDGEAQMGTTQKISLALETPASDILSAL
jgi:hypothetical protein